MLFIILLALVSLINFGLFLRFKRSMGTLALGWAMVAQGMAPLYLYALLKELGAVDSSTVPAVFLSLFLVFVYPAFSLPELLRESRAMRKMTPEEKIEYKRGRRSAGQMMEYYSMVAVVIFVLIAGYRLPAVTASDLVIKELGMSFFAAWLLFLVWRIVRLRAAKRQ